MLQRHAQLLEDLYIRYNRARYVSPDPLELVRRYRRDDDREVAGLLAACLAYGRVAQILRSVGTVLDRLGEHPAQRVGGLDDAGLAEVTRGLRHRFADHTHIGGLLRSAGLIRREYGSLGECFGDCYQRRQDAREALADFAALLRDRAGADLGHLVPDVTRGSACKRLWLYLRWMVRSDQVDLGCWAGLSPANLMVPLDTHMHRIARQLGATSRRAADWRTASEITAAFAAIRPDDPVRYDFVLTRLGIHPQLRHIHLPGLILN